MQIFVPFPDINRCAKALDYRRLGKQRSEALTLIRIITGYQVLAWLYQVTCPSTDNDWPNWCKHLCKLYKEDKINLLLTQHEGNNIAYYLSTVDAYKYMADKDQYKPVDKKLSWWTHVATLSWVGHLDALKYYYNTILQEWISRGYKNNMKRFEINNPVILPPWWGTETIHKSHRSKLYQKDPEFYKSFCVDFTPDTVDYVWPRNQFTVEQLKRRIKTFDIL